MDDLDGLAEVHHLLVQIDPDGGIVAIADGDGVSVDIGIEDAALLRFLDRNAQPVEVFLVDVALDPDHLVRIGVAGVFRHPRNGGPVLAVHPVGLSCDDVTGVDVTFRILRLQLVHLLDAGLALLVPVIGVIQGAAPDHERKVPQRQERHVARMARHHGRGGPVVRHARSDPPHTVATGGIAHDVHLVGVHVQEHHGHLDDLLIEAVRFRTEMQVPGIRNRPGAQIHTFRGLVEPFLVLPLLVVRRRRSTAAAMQGNIQGTPVRGLVAIDFPPDGHLVLADLEDFVLIGIRERGVDGIPPLPLERGQVRLERIGLGLFFRVLRILPIFRVAVILGLTGMGHRQGRNQTQGDKGEKAFHRSVVDCFFIRRAGGTVRKRA